MSQEDSMMQPCRKGCGELVHLENDGFHVCKTKDQVAMKPYHVWDFIAEELEARGWTLHDLAERMGDTHSTDVHYLSLEFLEASKDMTDVAVTMRTMAPALALAFGTSAEFWTNLHDQWKAANP
jgi:plasmid maintenance system antidote protein VapI